jgi:hypothetical protein
MTGLARVHAADKHLGRACLYTCLSLHPRVIPGIEQPRERDLCGCCHGQTIADNSFTDELLSSKKAVNHHLQLALASGS